MSGNILPGRAAGSIPGSSTKGPQRCGPFSLLVRAIGPTRTSAERSLGDVQLRSVSRRRTGYRLNLLCLLPLV